MVNRVYAIHPGRFNGKKYVRVYFMDFIELEDFKKGLANYVDDVSDIAMNPVDMISELDFGKENN